jgi:hypothetical protein
VPMFGRGDLDRVDVLIVKDLAHVFDPFRRNAV